MSIKEKPLIDAVERLGPLPAFLFAHPIIAGFFAMVMCAVFGAVVAMFWALFGTAQEMYEAMRLGAIVVTAYAVMIFVGIFFNAFREPEETPTRLQFVLGGAIGLTLLITFDLLTVDYFRAYFTDHGYLICTSVCD